jgi:hypothetical protein
MGTMAKPSQHTKFVCEREGKKLLSGKVGGNIHSLCPLSQPSPALSPAPAPARIGQLSQGLEPREAGLQAGLQAEQSLTAMCTKQLRQLGLFACFISLLISSRVTLGWATKRWSETEGEPASFSILHLAPSPSNKWAGPKFLHLALTYSPFSSPQMLQLSHWALRSSSKFIFFIQKCNFAWHNHPVCFYV